MAENQILSKEGENGEMENFHWLDRAKGYDLISMSRQAKLTAIAVNLKRIAKILSSQITSSPGSIPIFLQKFDRYKKTHQICA